MARPVILLLGVFILCTCLALTDGRPKRKSRNISRRDDSVPAEAKDDDGGSARDDRSDSDEDQRDVKRDDGPTTDAESYDERRDTRSRDSNSDENDDDDGSSSREKRAPVKSSKESKSKSKSKEKTSKEDLCPFGTKYKSECNHCFCNPKNGVTGCTMMGCYKLVIPTTAAPANSTEATAASAAEAPTSE